MKSFQDKAISELRIADIGSGDGSSRKSLVKAVRKGVHPLV